MDQPNLSRRDFLKASAATGAAVAVFTPVTSPLKRLAKTEKPAQNAQVERIRTICRSCGKMECGVWVTMRDGRAVKIEGDDSAITSEGNCCTKSMAALQAVYHPDRLTYPMKRTTPKGEEPGWVRITWDEALTTAANKFAEIRDKYGPEAIFTMGGTSRVWSMAPYHAAKFMLGTPNGHLAYQICKGPRHFGTQLTSFKNSSWMALVDGVKVFTQWGSETTISNYDDSGRVTVDRRFKADKHIVVAPRLQHFGPQADIWLPLRPGTDAAMALAWMDVIIKEGLYDKDFCQKWTNGPFLYADDIEPSGFAWDYYYPMEIKTKLVKESDLVEGGSPQKFAVHDEITGAIHFWDAANDVWDVAPPAIEPALFGTYTVKLKDGREVSAKPVFQKLADRAAEFSPEKSEKITWVPAEKVKEAARVYASKPGNGGIHYMLGIEQSGNAVPNVMALNALVCITGNMDTPGGHRGNTSDQGNPAGDKANLFGFGAWDVGPGGPGVSLESRNKILGSEKFPLLPWWGTWADATAIWDAIHTGKPYPVKALWAQSGDPMNQSNTAYAWEAMRKLDFHFEINLWHAPSAENADILVPCLHWLEVEYPRSSQGSSGGAGASTGPVKPHGECKHDLEIVVGIAEKMGIPFWPEAFGTKWPTLQQALDFAVTTGFNMTWAEYKAKFQKDGWWDVKELQPDTWGTYRRYETGNLRNDGKTGFPQPTGKVELLSTTVETYHPGSGMELPMHVEPPESPVARPELYDEYPLTCITGRRIPVYFHNEHRQLPWCRENWPVPLMEINPKTAAKLGIKQGDWVWIESPYGKVRQTADLYAGVAENVINAEHLWWYPEAPSPEKGSQYSEINRIVNKDAQCPICGATCLRGYPVKVYKAVEGAPEGIITSAKDPRLREWLPLSEAEIRG